MSENSQKMSMGWIPDYPDIRDFTAETEHIKPILDKTKIGKAGKLTLATSVDLRAWCSPIENQESLGSCTANAGIGMLEYYERRAFGKHTDASRLFLYKATRNLLHWVGDTGAYLRATMGALTLFGAPPEEYWPYVIADFDKEPTAFCYAFGQNFQSINYYRLDPAGTSTTTLLGSIKNGLSSGLPAMFGFTVYSSYTQAVSTGKIPFPTSGDKVVGGHAVVAVGYDDTMKIKNTNPGAIETTGAILIRNSWGTGWGSAGYGWLPYDYILKGLAVDWWSIIKSEWVDTGVFK